MKKTSYVINFTRDIQSPLYKYYWDLAPHVNLFLFPDLFNVRSLIEKGFDADWLPPAFEEEFCNPKGSKGTYNDVVFVGSNYRDKYPLSEYRDNLVHFLKEKLGGKFSYYGFGWEDGINYLHTQQEAECFRSAKIVVSFNHLNLPRYTSDRLYKAMACGAFCLSQNYMAIDYEFEVGKHLDTFNNMNHLLQKIFYYLDNDIERAKIADAGCRLVNQEMNWDNRVKHLKNILITRSIIN
jgi:hypothetical protein